MPLVHRLIDELAAVRGSDHLVDLAESLRQRFSHWTCLLWRRHSIDIAACQWSGVPMVTASICLSVRQHLA